MRSLRHRVHRGARPLSIGLGLCGVFLAVLLPAAGEMRRALRIEGPSSSPCEVGSVTRCFNGRPIRPVRTVRMRVAAYGSERIPDHRGGPRLTASGCSVHTNAGELVAADARCFSFGALLSIPGYAAGDVVPVLDRGPQVVGRRLEVFLPDHESVVAWGVRHLDVVVWEYADEEPALFPVPSR
ncbi:MAG: hypothetical protein MK085_09580 [Phycisphaerales bacterium]|nr:hypothetical protein [Phycisphaerales bacterium]